MNLGRTSSEIVEKIANAVLYEGYILYPYRPSAIKNRQRWNFGGLCPKGYSEAQNGSERWSSRTECLAEDNGRSTINIKIRFLHLIDRQLARLDRSVTNLAECSDSDFSFVQAIEINGRLFQAWQEASECAIDMPSFFLSGDAEERPLFNFHVPESKVVEPLRDSQGKIAGVFVRRQIALDGAARVKAERVQDSLFKVTLEVSNLTLLENASGISRDQAMTHSLVSSHVILSIRNGEFVSLLDPPEQYADQAAQCQSIGTYPVLVGKQGDHSAVLSSAVILYDYPQIAPESSGDLFDGAEIDEILTLRILTLTEQEKSEMRQCDERARQLLERIESEPQHLAQLHGTMRPVDRMGGKNQ
jgi:hypothetical protein